jgi:hypothetical protein
LIPPKENAAIIHPVSRQLDDIALLAKRVLSVITLASVKKDSRPGDIVSGAVAAAAGAGLL